MQKASSFVESLNKKFRSGTDSWREAFVLSRNLRHLGRLATARRSARVVQPRPDLVVAPEQGFRLYPPGTFAEADAVVAHAQQLLADVAGEPVGARRKGAGRKRFLINLLDRDTLDLSHPIIRLSLSPTMLDIIVHYMGVVPLLRSAQVFYSGALEKDPTSSQLYHCDADDTRQMKIFVLCSEVTSANGPLTILDAERSARVRKAYGYRYHSRLRDEQVAAVAGGDATEIVGPPGTVCLVDTSRCFHYGSRVEPGAAPRLVTMVQYLSPWAFVIPGDYRRGALLPALEMPHASPLQRAVATGDYAHLKTKATSAS